MFKAETTIRVRYAETDQMGYVYYGNYAAYFETARVEALRGLGLTYRKLEEEGILMPVLEFKCKYIRPALYDDLLTIRTVIPEKPGMRIRFNYETLNENEELLNTGETTLVFVDKTTGRPTQCPRTLDFVLKPFFDEA